MLLPAGALLLLLLLALLLPGRAAPAVRCGTCGLVLLLLAVAVQPPGVDYRDEAAALPAAAGAAASRTARPIASMLAAGPAQAAMQAAAVAGPRQVDLQLEWVEPWPAAVAGLLGGQATYRGKALPADPAAVAASLLRPAVAGRPNALRFALPDELATLPVELLLVGDGEPLLQQSCSLLDGLELPFLPLQQGELQLRLRWQHGAHQVERRGRFAVAAAPPILVAERGEVLLPALQAQGIAARAVTDWQDPDLDLAGAAAVLLATAVPVPAQAALEAAVRDGLGLFATAAAFAAAGEPLHDLLPLRPVPPTTAAADQPSPLAQTTPSGDPPAPPAEPPASEQTPPAAPAPLDPRAAGPVSSEPVEVDKHAIAMVLVVDRSGSMGALVTGGRTRMDYAKASALQSSEALQEGDQLGIATFGNQGAGRIELPLTDAMDRATIRRGVEKLAAAREFTYMLSGLQQAAAELQRSKAAVKHVVVISDGEFQTTEGMAMRRLARTMREGGITLSILSIIAPGSVGDFQRYALEIATAGGGVFLAESDPSRVPVFVSAELTRALSRVGRRPASGDSQNQPPPLPLPGEPPPVPPKSQEPAPEPAEPPDALSWPVRAVADSSLLQPSPEPDWPALAAASIATAPLDAAVLLVAGEAGHPLLAFAHRGLGRVGVFAAELDGPAAQDFRREPAFPARLGLWLEHVSRALPQAAAAALLDATAVQPPAPTPAELRALASLSGTTPLPADAALEPPPPAIRRVLRGPDPALALFGLALLVALLWLEWRAQQQVAGPHSS